jgi:hypothetical protein
LSDKEEQEIFYAIDPKIRFKKILDEFIEHIFLINNFNNKVNKEIENAFQESDKLINSQIKKFVENTKFTWKDYVDSRNYCAGDRGTKVNLPMPDMNVLNDELKEILLKKSKEDLVIVNSIWMEINFKREMLLVFLVSKFESFVYDNLRLFYYVKPESLLHKDKTKSSKHEDKIISYQDMFELNNFQDIKELIAEREAKKRIAHGHDSYVKYLINLGVPNLLYMDLYWFNFTFDCRHLIIHSDGILDRKYLHKIGAKKRKNHPIPVNVRYDFLKSATNAFEKYATSIYCQFTKKCISNKD